MESIDNKTLQEDCGESRMRKAWMAPKVLLGTLDDIVAKDGAFVDGTVIATSVS